MANYIEIVSSLIYGDLGATELGPAPAGTKNLLNFTLDWVQSPPAAGVAGDQFLAHHLDVMLSRYKAWRSLHFLPPLRPWDGSDAFPDNDPATAPIGPPVPTSLAGGAFPAGWTTNDLGNAVLTYYHAATDGIRNFVSPTGAGMELDDEIKAPFSYRYWAFMRWVEDLRRRLLGLPVLATVPVYDRNGTVLSEKEFTDIFHQVHHIWHPNGGTVASWTQPTPGFQTSVGQHRRKKQISRTQVGAEFFAFHRDHLLLFDRWLSRTGQDPVQSINMCAHDTAGGPLPSPPAGLDVISGGLGYPVVNYVTRAVDFAPPHNNMWDGTRPGFDGTLREFASVGEMGQFFATDFNPFPSISVPDAAAADAGYHGPGHNLNGDIRQPIANNFVPRFFAWHGFIDDLWTKRQPHFEVLTPVQADGSAFADPKILTILRDLAIATDAVEPAAAIPGLDLVTGTGTLRVQIRVRPDPFNRPMELRLRCDVLREAGGPSAVISLQRDLVITVGAPAAPNERQQGVDFIENFAFDGSVGTVDAAGKGPFATDNASFPPAGPSATGFLNSLIRVSGHLICTQQPDGSIPAHTGSISSVGTQVTGVGTDFPTLFRQGDLIRAMGQVRMITTIVSPTSLNIYEPFAPDIPPGTVYERLDGFDHEETLEIPLLQEKLAPAVTTYLDRSSFSKDQVDAIAAAGHSTFENAFYVIIQDRTERPAPINWPSEVEPQLHGLIAPPLHAAGLYPDLAHAPIIELRDATTNATTAGQIDVTVTSADPEDPLLHPSIPQRITYRCRVTFTGNAIFDGMNAGDTKDLRLAITATDRSGNRVVEDSSIVRLQVNANPYMLDGPVSWISTDTRVFKVRQGQARFGVAAGWSDPNAFIAQTIDNLRAGNGIAGGESFDSLPTEQAAAVLEYSSQVDGVNVFNFALAKVRLQSVTGAGDVRASFRLFRWGVANVAFDPTLAYRTHPSTGIALLGRTTTNELASLPFFAAARVPTTVSMTTQTDPKNLFTFGPTGGAEAASFYGAYLDINQGTPRFPHTFVGDGGFGSTPPADMRSIRDLLISQHQCMIVELVYTPDPIAMGATPGTSDNLSQRNLLIVSTANPGLDNLTRTIQHSFDIDLTRRQRPAQPLTHLVDAEHDAAHVPDLIDSVRPARPASALMDAHHHHAGLDHLVGGWLEPDTVHELRKRAATERAEIARWQIDPETWKPTDGLDELVFFWNNLPRDSQVELYLPQTQVEEIYNYRSLRHAPDNVKIVDSHTLRLTVAGPTYLPIPPFWGDNVAGLVTATLPAGIKSGQKFTVDVVHIRSAPRQVLGGFQINIQVGKTRELVPPALRMLALFHQRLGLTPTTSRWRLILERQTEFLREHARRLVEQANDPDLPWNDPTEKQQGQRIRVVLERLQILDDHDPFIKGAGEFRFKARVHTRNNGGIYSETRLPEKGHYHISDKPGRNTVHINLPLFEGFVEDHIAMEIAGIEMDTFDPDDKLRPYRRVFTGLPAEWLGSIGPGADPIEPEDLGDWRLWYRIERA